MPPRRIFLDSWANRASWPNSIDFPRIQLREVHEAVCYLPNFTKRLVNSTSPMHRVFEQIPTSPRQKAVMIFSIIFGIFGLLGILITLGNLLLFFAERKDKRKEEERKRELSDGLMMNERSNTVLRINGQRLSRDESILEGRQDERLQKWRSEGAERV